MKNSIMMCALIFVNSIIQSSENNRPCTPPAQIATAPTTQAEKDALLQKIEQEQQQKYLEEKSNRPLNYQLQALALGTENQRNSPDDDVSAS